MQSQTIGTTVQINNNNYDDANPLNLEFYYFFFFEKKNQETALFEKCSIFNFILSNGLQLSDFEFWLVFRVNSIGHLDLLVNQGKKFASC